MTKDEDSNIGVQNPTVLKDYLMLKWKKKNTQQTNPTNISHTVFMTLSPSVTAKNVKLDQRIKESLERK